MRKMLSLVLVLAMASVASATYTAAFLSGGMDYLEVEAGDVITVELVYALDTGFMTVTKIIDTASTQGTVSNALVDPDFDWAIFTGIGGTNGLDFLLEDVTGKTDFGSPPVTGTLLSFDYEVSGLLPLNEEFQIGAGAGYVEIGVDIRDATDIGPLTILVVPEPATVALLGLGALVLRRRK